jgi:hypothetical protein
MSRCCTPNRGKRKAVNQDFFTPYLWLLQQYLTVTTTPVEMMLNTPILYLVTLRLSGLIVTTRFLEGLARTLSSFFFQVEPTPLRALQRLDVTRARHRIGLVIIDRRRSLYQVVLPTPETISRPVRPTLETSPRNSKALDLRLSLMRLTFTGL